VLQRAQAVVDTRVHLQHVEPLLDELDRRQEALALQAVGPQAVRRIVRRHHEHDARGEQRVEQAAQDHRIGDVRDMELVEADQAPLARHAGGNDGERVLSSFTRASAACTSRMNAWKWTRVLRRTGTVA
jgi:hypothetical protein